MTTAPEPFQIDREEAGEFAGIVTIRLSQAGKPVVVLDLPLIQRLEATLKALPSDTRGLVLASASERVFIAGADLKTIQDATDDQLHRYLAYASGVFAMISNLPYPTVAAINGAALGGGLELAMHCDALVAAPSFSGKAYPVGLPECGLSICPGWGGTNLLPARIDPAAAISMTAEGKPINFDEAKAAGLFDAVAATPADLIPTAMRWIVDRRAKGRLDRDGSPHRCISRPAAATATLRALDTIRGDLPKTEAAAAVALAVDAGLSRGWKAALDTEQHELVRLRNTPAGKQAIAAFFAKAK